MITRLNSIINDKLIFKSKVIKLKFLITGGLGFIGSSLIRKIIKETDDQVLNLDKQTYASNILNLKSIELDERYNFIKGDICDEILIEKLLFDFQPDYLMHLAAESHVDNSINNPSEFIRTNIFGSQYHCSYSRGHIGYLFQGRKESWYTLGMADEKDGIKKIRKRE